MEREMRNLIESWLLLIVFPIDYLDSFLIRYLRVPTPPHLIDIVFERPLLRSFAKWEREERDGA